jgi:hypothetical protein
VRDDLRRYVLDTLTSLGGVFVADETGSSRRAPNLLACGDSILAPQEGSRTANWVSS